MNASYFDGVLPIVALLGAMLSRAKLDAQAGDVCALLWLLSDGAVIADAIHPDGGALLRAWVNEYFNHSMEV